MRTVRDPADFLQNPLRYQASFNRTKSVLAQFTPGNSLVFLGTHKITIAANVSELLNFTSSESPPTSNNGSSDVVQFPWPELDNVEPIYCTPFHHDVIPESLLNYWNVSKTDVGNLQLPSTNLFIPDPASLTIIEKFPNATNQPVKLPGTQDSVSMWSLLDTKDFHEPRVNIECLLNNTNVTISPSWEGEFLSSISLTV